jgi:hypothetical protein
MVKPEPDPLERVSVPNQAALKIPQRLIQTDIPGVLKPIIQKDRQWTNTDSLTEIDFIRLQNAEKN